MNSQVVLPTGLGQNGDLVAFETNDRTRAKAKLEEFKTSLEGAHSETMRRV